MTIFSLIVQTAVLANKAFQQIDKHFPQHPFKNILLRLNGILKYVKFYLVEANPEFQMEFEQSLMEHMSTLSKLFERMSSDSITLDDFKLLLSNNGVEDKIRQLQNELTNTFILPVVIDSYKSLNLALTENTSTAQIGNDNVIASLLNIEENINGNLAHMQITVDDLQQKNGQLNETITTLLGENHELSQRNLLLEEKIKCLTRHVRTMATSSVGTEKTLLQSVHDALLYLNNENSVITGLKSPELKESIKNLLNDYDPIDHLVSNSLSAK